MVFGGFHASPVKPQHFLAWIEIGFFSDNETGARMQCFWDIMALQLQQTIKGLQTVVQQSLLVGQVSSEHSCSSQQLSSLQLSDDEAKIVAAVG
ncbi:MAG: hypothetical protein ACXVC2_02825 [Bacteroidia bacterium]